MKRAGSFLSVSERGKVLLVPVKDILYLKAELKYIRRAHRQRNTCWKIAPRIWAGIHRTFCAFTANAWFAQRHHQFERKSATKATATGKSSSGRPRTPAHQPRRQRAIVQNSSALNKAFPEKLDIPAKIFK